MNNHCIKKNIVITILSKKEYKYLFLLIASVFSVQSVVCQDIIKLQYKDSITVKVLAINKKDVIYQSQEFYDSGIYAINRRKVMKVKYANGNTASVSKSRWDKLYRPSVYFCTGMYEYEKINDFEINNNFIGFGNKGFLRLPIKVFGIIYNADFRFGQYDYYKKNLPTGGNINESGYYYSVNLFAGLEYRFSIFRGLGFYVDFQAGRSYIKYDHPAEYYSNRLLYSGSTGIYMYRYQLGLKYSWGHLNQQSVLKEGDIMQSMSSYDLAEISFFAAFAF
jgi:hypothetical protein